MERAGFGVGAVGGGAMSYWDIISWRPSILTTNPDDNLPAPEQSPLPHVPSVAVAIPGNVSAAVPVNGTQVVVSGAPSAVAEAVRTLTGKGE